MSTESWTRVIDGTTYTAMTPEVSPGVHHVTSELLEQMLRELGWAPTTDAEGAEG